MLQNYSFVKSCKDVSVSRWELTQNKERDCHSQDGRRGRQRMGHRHRPGPLAVVPSVAGAARTQVAGPEVGAGASVQTGLPQAFIDVLARTPHELTPWATAESSVI